MNTKLMEAIGQFIDANYYTEYKIEGYFGFAYIVVGDYKWHFFVDMDGNVQREKVGMMIR
jgi:hypothetical protein